MGLLSQSSTKHFSHLSLSVNLKISFFMVFILLLLLYYLLYCYFIFPVSVCLIVFVAVCPRWSDEGSYSVDTLPCWLLLPPNHLLNHYFTTTNPLLWIYYLLSPLSYYDNYVLWILLPQTSQVRISDLLGPFYTYLQQNQIISRKFPDLKAHVTGTITLKLPL